MNERERERERERHKYKTTKANKSQKLSFLYFPIMKRVHFFRMERLRKWMAHFLSTWFANSDIHKCFYRHRRQGKRFCLFHRDVKKRKEKERRKERNRRDVIPVEFPAKR
jgi:hypothetical protein